MKQILFGLILTTLLGLTVPVHAQEKKEDTPAEPKVEMFTFDGGTLNSFISAIHRQLNFNLAREAAIDPKAVNLQIPKMKIPVRENGWEFVLINYNNLSRQMEDSLGRWSIYRGAAMQNDSMPNAIVFLPPNHLINQTILKVKAFSVDKLKVEDLEKLELLIDEQAHILRDTVDRIGKSGNFDGRIRYHGGTGLLIASGGQEFVEMAATIIEAFKETLDKRKLL